MSTRPPVPAIIICRDRVTYARDCLNGLLHSSGVGDIHLVDHGSTYPPMRDWLASLAHPRIHLHLQGNAHPRDLWTDGTLPRIVRSGQRYIVTDHDLLVPEGVEWVAHLHELLDAFPRVAKAGLQLDIDGIPDGAINRRKVIDWESGYRLPEQLVTAPPLWASKASVDTTVALYRDYVWNEPFRLDPALRTVRPDMSAAHLPWWEMPDDYAPDAPRRKELEWYRKYARYGHWRAPDGFTDNHGLEGSA